MLLMWAAVAAAVWSCNCCWVTLATAAAWAAAAEPAVGRNIAVVAAPDGPGICFSLKIQEIVFLTIKKGEGLAGWLCCCPLGWELLQRQAQGCVLPCNNNDNNNSSIHFPRSDSVIIHLCQQWTWPGHCDMCRGCLKLETEVKEEKRDGEDTAYLKDCNNILHWAWVGPCHRACCRFAEICHQ